MSANVKSVENVSTFVVDAPLPVPVIDQLRCFSASFDLSWHSGDPLVMASSSTITVFDGTTAVKSYSGGLESGTFDIPSGLDPVKRYTVGVLETVGGVESPYSTQVVLVMSPPSVTAATAHEGDSVASITVSAPSGYADCSEFTASVQAQDGTSLGQGSGSGGTISVALSRSVAGADVLTVTAAMKYGNSSSPTCTDESVTIIVTPRITSIACDGANVNMAWSYLNQSPTQSYLISVFDDEVVKQNVVQTGLLTLGFALEFTPDPAKPYTVQAAATQGVSVGPFSDPERLIINKSTITSTNFDGTTISAVYSFPSGSAPGTGWLTSLYKGDQIIQNSFGNGEPAFITPSSPTDPASSYSVAIVSAQGVATGPVSSGVKLVSQAPTILSLSYDGASITAQYAPPFGVTPDIYVVTLFKDGQPVQSVTEKNVVKVFTPTLPLEPSAFYEVGVAMMTGVSTGPVCAKISVIQARPTIVSLGWDGALGSAAILFPTQEWMTANLCVTLLRDGNVVENFQGKGSYLTFTPQSAPTTGHVYTVKVCLSQGSSFGPFSNSPVLVIETTSLTKLVFDGASVSIWSQSPPSDAPLTIYSLYSGTTLVRNQIGTSSAVIPCPGGLDPTVVYTVKAALAVDVSVGQSSAPTTVTTQKPTISLVSYDGQNITITMQNPSGSPTSALLALYADGTVAATGQATGAGGVITPGFQLVSGVIYTVSACFSDGIVTGPPGVPASIPIVVAPVPVSMDFNGTDLSASWILPDPSVGDGFLLCIYSGTTVVRNVPGNGTSTNAANVGGLFPPGGSYSVKVASVIGTQVGPFSASVVVLIDKPTVASVFYNGQSVSANWSLLDVLKTGIGYRLTFFKDGVSQDVNTGSGVSASFVPSVAINPASVYTLSVASLQGISTGPDSPTLTLVALSAPTIMSLGYSEPNGTQTVSLVWQGLTNSPGISGYMISIFVGDVIFFNQYSAIQTTTFSPPQGMSFDHEKTYSIKVAGVSGASVGPFSLAAPILLKAPTLSYCIFDGVLLNLSWTFPDPSIGQSVLITLSQGASVIRNYVAEGLSTSVTPPSFTGAEPYTVSVASTSGSSVGLFGSPLAVLYTMPTALRLSYMSALLTSTWDFMDTPGVQFKSRLKRNGFQVEEVSAAAHSAVFTTALAAGYLYEADVRTVNGASEGPPTNLEQGPFLGVCTFSFDSFGRVETVATANFNTVTFAYDNTGNMLSVTTAPPSPSQGG